MEAITHAPTQHAAEAAPSSLAHSFPYLNGEMQFAPGQADDSDMPDLMSQMTAHTPLDQRTASPQPATADATTTATATTTVTVTATPSAETSTEIADKAATPPAEPLAASTDPSDPAALTDPLIPASAPAPATASAEAPSLSPHSSPRHQAQSTAPISTAPTFPQTPIKPVEDQPTITADFFKIDGIDDAEINPLNVPGLTESQDASADLLADPMTVADAPPILPSLEQPEPDEPDPMEAFAKLAFPDGDFYVHTYAVELGRDVNAHKHERKTYKQLKRKGRREQKEQAERRKRSSGEVADDCVSPRDTGSGNLDHQYQSTARSVGNISEVGGILGVSVYSSDEGSRTSRRRKRKQMRSSNSSHSLDPTTLSANPQDLMQIWDQEIPAPPRGLPDGLPDHAYQCPLIPIHPQAGASFKGISRRHVRIEYNLEKGFWEMFVTGRNTVFHNNDRIETGGSARLHHGSEILIQTIAIIFKLPDNARGEEEDVQEVYESDSPLSEVADEFDDGSSEEDVPLRKRHASSPKRKVIKLKLSLQNRHKLAQKFPSSAKKEKQGKSDKASKSIKSSTKPDKADKTTKSDKEKTSKKDRPEKADKLEKAVEKEKPEKVKVENAEKSEEPKPVDKPAAVEAPVMPPPPPAVSSSSSSLPADVQPSVEIESDHPLMALKSVPGSSVTSETPPAIPAELPPGSVLVGVAPEDIPAKRKGPGRPPKNGVMSKRDEAIIKRLTKELQKQGKMVPSLNDLLLMARAEGGTKKDRPEDEKGLDGKPSLEGSITPGPSQPSDGNIVQSIEPSLQGTPQAATQASPDNKDTKPKRIVRTPSPQKPESEYTEEELKKPTQTYVVLIHEALSKSATGIMDLQQIYDAMQKMYPFFKYRAGTSGWQSSVRHNLISSEAFQEAGKIGKGRLWKINPDVSIDKEKKRKAPTPPPQSAPQYPYYGNQQYPYGQPQQHGGAGYPQYPRPSPYGTPYGPPAPPPGGRPPAPTGQQKPGAYYSPYASNPMGGAHASPYGPPSRPPYASAYPPPNQGQPNAPGQAPPPGQSPYGQPPHQGQPPNQGQPPHQGQPPIQNGQPAQPGQQGQQSAPNGQPPPPGQPPQQSQSQPPNGQPVQQGQYQGPPNGQYAPPQTNAPPQQGQYQRQNAPYQPQNGQPPPQNGQPPQQNGPPPQNGQYAPQQNGHQGSQPPYQAGGSQPPPPPTPPPQQAAAPPGGIDITKALTNIMNYQHQYIGAFSAGKEQDDARVLFTKAMTRGISGQFPEGGFESKAEEDLTKKIADIYAQSRFEPVRQAPPPPQQSQQPLPQNGQAAQNGVQGQYSSGQPTPSPAPAASLQNGQPHPRPPQPSNVTTPAPPQGNIPARYLPPQYNPQAAANAPTLPQAQPQQQQRQGSTSDAHLAQALRAAMPGAGTPHPQTQQPAPGTPAQGQYSQPPPKSPYQPSPSPYAQNQAPNQAQRPMPSGSQGNTPAPGQGFAAPPAPSMQQQQTNPGNGNGSGNVNTAQAPKAVASGSAVPVTSQQTMPPQSAVQSGAQSRPQSQGVSPAPQASMQAGSTTQGASPAQTSQQQQQPPRPTFTPAPNAQSGQQASKIPPRPTFAPSPVPGGAAGGSTSALAAQVQGSTPVVSASPAPPPTSAPSPSTAGPPSNQSQTPSGPNSASMQAQAPAQAQASIQGQAPPAQPQGQTQQPASQLQNQETTANGASLKRPIEIDEEESGPSEAKKIKTDGKAET